MYMSAVAMFILASAVYCLVYILYLYEHMQNYKDLRKILKYKRDAIAFERIPNSTSVRYKDQLPASVNSRFSE